jgi:hypothetical protein
MSHFAKIDENNFVIEVAVGDNNLPEEGKIWFEENIGGTWIQTSYNGSFRKNFAGIGYYFDATLDAFIPPKLFASWVLDEETASWKPPIERPSDTDALYEWDESQLQWVKLST